MKIPKDFDCVNKAAPSADSGTDMRDDPGIKPVSSAMGNNADSKATNTQTADRMNKAQPFKKTGTGYTD